MSNNYIEVQSRSPFSTRFFYIDVEDYKADDIFLEFGIFPRFYEHIYFSNSQYVAILCRIPRKQRHMFEKAMAKLHQKMVLTGNEDYDKFCDEIMAQLLNEEEDKATDIGQ